MDLRTTTVMAIGLSLAACACDKVRSPAGRAHVKGSTRTVNMDSLHFDRRAGAQLAWMAWNRPGEWSPVKVDTDDRRIHAGLVSRDRFGARLVTLRPMRGYDMRQIHLTCERRSVVISDVRSVATDVATIEKSSKPSTDAVRMMMPPGEVQRICNGMATAMEGKPTDAVTRLRQVSLKAVEQPKPPVASDRSSAWRRYQAEHAGGR